MSTGGSDMIGWRRTFLTIWSGQQVSLLGSAAVNFGLVWWLTARTGSATVLAIGTLITMLPTVFLGPFVGALVDRWSRRAVMVFADGLIALFAIWLGVLFLLGEAQVGHVYVLLLARAVAAVFHMPAMQASTALMVPEKHLARVAGLNQTMQGAVSVLGPPAGALLVSLLPMHGVMAVDVLTAAVAIGPLLFIAVPRPRRAASSKPMVATLWLDVREAFAYVWRWPGMNLVLVSSMAITFFVYPAISLIPILVTKVFGGAAFHLGWLTSTWGLGYIVGGLLLGVWGGFRRRIVTVMVGAIGLGVGILIVGLAASRGFALAIVGMFIASALYAMVTGSAIALLQALVAPEMHGRVFTLVISLTTGIAPIAMAIAGPVADAAGVRVWFIAGGVVTITLGALGLLRKSVRHIEDAQNSHAPVLQAQPSSTPSG